MKKIIICKVSVVFFKWNIKNIPDWQQCVHFRKKQKSVKSLHPTVLYRSTVEEEEGHVDGIIGDITQYSTYVYTENT